MSKPVAHRRLIHPVLTTGVGIALVLGVQQQGLTAAATVRPDPVVKLRKDKPIKGGQKAVPVPRQADPAQARAVRSAPHVRWPDAGVAEVTVPQPTAWALMLNGGRVSERVRAGDLPVWVAPTAAAAQERLRTGAMPSLPSKVKVESLGRRGDAFVLRVHRTDGITGQGRLTLGVDYRAFQEAFGGDWGTRLRVVSGGTVLPTRNNGSGQLTTEIPIGAQARTFAVMAGPSSGAGDFKKSDLSDGGATWSIGTSSGDFEWSLPLTVPPSIGGPEPNLMLQYSSGGLDGLSSASNNQPGIAGMGFDIGGGGAIERRYKSCSKDRSGGNNANRETGDLCFAGDSMSISVDGKAGSLVLHHRDATGEAWRMKGDDGSVVERFYGAVNGDDGVLASDKGEYWRLTTTEGTRYYFGLNRLPGWTAGANHPETRSAWTAPVFGNHGGEQCNKAAFADSWCRQAYRWNLDYAVDRHGNTMSLFYDVETDNYARNLTATTVSSYIRAGNLKRIEYGQRNGQVFSQKSVAQVLFGTAERCVGPCGPTQPATYPDTPWDLHCASTSNCTNHFTPTFWTQKRLAKITTQVWRANTNRHEDVQTWTLRHDYVRGDNTGPALWLEAISPAGHVGPSIQTPEINFDGVARDNRVDTSSDMVPPMQWFRISAVHHGTGGDLAVTYTGVDCTPASLPVAADNNRRCRPQKWTPEGAAERQDWFHKYVVSQVVEADRTAGPNTLSAPVPVVTTVQYPRPPAWHFDEMDATTSVADSTWSQWRGYDRVRLTKGIPGETQTVTEGLYYRGMDGDRSATGGAKDVKITDSTGVVQDDINEFSGQVREELKLDGAAVTDKSITDYWRSEPTATMVRPWGTLEARHLNHKRVRQFQKIDSGYRQLATEHIYDAAGRLLARDIENDVSTPADDACVKYDYVANPAKGLLELPARELVTSTGCDQQATNTQVVSDDRVYYDDATSHTATPARGVVTKAERLSGFDSTGKPEYETVFTATYDAIGRQTSVTNALQKSIQNVITPSYGPMTKVVTIEPNGNQTTTEFEPAFGDKVAITGPDGRRTVSKLDALGRLSKTWKPGRSSATDPPDVEYGYLLRDNGPNVVTTKTRRDADSIDVTYELYDGLQRLRQTQEPTPAGGTLVTDHRYDSRGNQVELNGPFYNDAPPDTELLPVDPQTLPKQQQTKWDNQDRPEAQIVKADGRMMWQTSHDVNPGRQSVDPPPGQTPTTRILDALGRLVELRQYFGDDAAGEDYDKTTYSYDPAGRLKTILDPAGNQWTYDYDVQGRKIREDDPDTGITTYEYNVLDQVASRTDSRGVKLVYTYDENGRRRKLQRDSLQGPTQAEWTYDTLAKGKLTSATRYVGTNAYTTAVTGYDAAGRVAGTSVTLPASEGRLAGTYAIGQAYNDDDTLATRTLPKVGDLATETLTYDHNDQGLAKTLRSELGSYVLDNTYTPFEETDTLTLGTGSGRWVQQKYEYDPTTRRPTRVVTEKQALPRLVSDTTYAYDPGGNITKITDAPSASTGEPTDTQCFSYDYLRRLTSAWTPASGDCTAAPTAGSLGAPAPYWHKWTFDKTGNRRTEQRISSAGTATSTYTYGTTQPHTLDGVTTTGPSGTTTKTFDYDPAGNTTNRTAAGVPETLAWDSEGHLASVAKAGKTTSFVYDADGNRLLRKDPSGTTLYFGETELTLGTDGSTLTGTRYYSFNDRVVAVRTNGKLSWLLGDLQGTPTIAIDEANQTVQRRRTTPYGELRGTPPASWPGQRDFVSGTSDPSTGLVHLGAREYDQTTGRFISVDPIIDPEDPQQLNGYAYANNNPVSFVDADGKVLVPILVPVLSIAIVVVAVMVILAVLVLLIYYVTVARQERVSAWDLVSWGLKVTVRTIYHVVQVIRQVIKLIAHLVLQVYIKPIIVWITKWIDNGVKPPRSKNNSKGSKGKPDKPSPKKPDKPKAPKKSNRPDTGKGNKPSKDTRGAKDPSKQKPNEQNPWKQTLEDFNKQNPRTDPSKYSYNEIETRPLQPFKPNYDPLDFSSMLPGPGPGPGRVALFTMELTAAGVAIARYFEKWGWWF